MRVFQIIAIYALLSVKTIFRFFNRTALGILTAAIILYWYARLTGGNVFSFEELVIFLDGLPIESKTFALTTLITISGFLFAFTSGYRLWIKQKRRELYLDFSDSLAVVIGDMSKEANYIRALYKTFLDKFEEFISKGDESIIFFSAQHLMNQFEKMEFSRTQFNERHLDFLRIIGVQSKLVHSITVAPRVLDVISNETSSIVPRLNLFIPYTQDIRKDLYSFLSMVDIKGMEEAVSEISASMGVINFNEGLLRGVIYDPIIDKPWHEIMAFHSVKGGLFDLIDDIKSRGKQ